MELSPYFLKLLVAKTQPTCRLGKNKSIFQNRLLHIVSLLNQTERDIMAFQEKIVLNPIGFVKTEAVGDEVKDKSRISQIILNSVFIQALDGITGFSHIFVIFYMSQIPEDKRMILKVHPRGRMDMPLLGAFATRTNLRPNPIGLTLVELLKVDSNILTVRGLDAFDGTPILDIKPFDPWDNAEKARVPDWWLKLNEEKR
jgi:tRNA-Thr(GGU) m(6)t(6)A37 methyltransferase TsaA